MIRVMTLCAESVKLQRLVTPSFKKQRQKSKRGRNDDGGCYCLLLASSRPVESLHPAVRAALVLSLPKPPVTTVRQRGATRGVRRASRNAATFERERAGRQFAQQSLPFRNSGHAGGARCCIRVVPATAVNVKAEKQRETPSIFAPKRRASRLAFDALSPIKLSKQTTMILCTTFLRGASILGKSLSAVTRFDKRIEACGGALLLRIGF